MRKFLKVLLYIMLFVAMLFLILIVTATLSDYRPKEKAVVFESSDPQLMPEWAELDFVIWNIGYCGLDDEMDFFYDGGTKVRTGRENVIENLHAVNELLGRNDTVEFFLLQEVDMDSHRSYNINEYDSIRFNLENYWSFFGKNYDVFFVPVPFTQPMGPVESGLQTLSRPHPSSSVRMSFPGNYAWPKSLFMLDRCFLVNRYTLNNGKELVVVNTHNSAYDDGSLRRMQMEYMKVFLQKEYEKRNYIIVGGDWNQCPPEFVPQYEDNVFDEDNYSVISGDYITDGWIWAYDPSTPTNRRLMMPYEEGVTPTTTIDFYLLSPNIELISRKCIDMGFEYSDHQPVFIKVKLLQ